MKRLRLDYEIRNGRDVLLGTADTLAKARDIARQKIAAGQIGVRVIEAEYLLNARTVWKQRQARRDDFALPQFQPGAA